MSWEGWLMEARRGRGPLRFARQAYRDLLDLRLPMIRPIFGTVSHGRDLLATAWTLTARFWYREPMIRYRAARVGRRLAVEGGIPQMLGDGRIEIGDDVRIGGRNTWIVGFKVSTGAELVIGDRVTIGYQALISAATSVRIGADTMLAGNVQIYDNPSHPLEPARRRRHEPFDIAEAHPVIVGENVWLGNRCTILRGVTIGDNSIVATGAVVTKSLPPNSLAAGNPARIIKTLTDDERTGEDPS